MTQLPLLLRRKPLLNEVNPRVRLGEGTGAERVAQPHDLPAGVSRGREVGQAVAVGVARPDEVGPVAGHLRLDLVVGRGPGDVGVVGVGDVVEDVPQLGAVVGAHLAVLGGRAGPVVRVHLALGAAGGPVDRPAPEADAVDVAEELVAALAGLAVVVGRVELEELAGEVPEHSGIGSFVGGRRDLRVWGGARLVLVAACQDGHVSVGVEA